MKTLNLLWITALFIIFGVSHFTTSNTDYNFWIIMFLFAIAKINADNNKSNFKD